MSQSWLPDETLPLMFKDERALRQFLTIYKTLPRPRFCVRTPHLEYLLFYFHPLVGRMKFEAVSRETVLGMGYEVIDLNEPASPREQEDMQSRVCETYLAPYATNEPELSKVEIVDGLRFIVYLQTDKGFLCVRSVAEEGEAGALSANPVPEEFIAKERCNVFDVRYPATEAERKERHNRWCNEPGYVLVFSRPRDIRAAE